MTPVRARRARVTAGDGALYRHYGETAFFYRVLLALAGSPGMPMQVVAPSVSLAAAPQGTAFTVFVETPSSPTLSKPVVVPGSHAVPSAGAAPVMGTVGDGGGVTAGGDPVWSTVVPGTCCANAGKEKRATAVATETAVLPKRIETSLELQQQENNPAHMKVPRDRALILFGMTLRSTHFLTTVSRKTRL